MKSKGMDWREGYYVKVRCQTLEQLIDHKLLLVNFVVDFFIFLFDKFILLTSKLELMDEPINKATWPNKQYPTIMGKKKCCKKEISRDEVGRIGLGVGFPIGKDGFES